MQANLFDTLPKADKTPKDDFKAAVPALRNQLVAMQQDLRNSKHSIIVVFAGVDGAGKHEMVNTLNAWMDPRGISTHAYLKPTPLEKERPPFWRFWRDLPANGQIGLFLSAWYSLPLLQRVRRQMSEDEFQAALDEIARFEKTLTDNGVILLKVWMHLDRKAQRKRLKKLSRDPATEWQVKPGAWENWGLYDRFIASSEQIIESSHNAGQPWVIIDGKRKRTRTLSVANILLEHATRALAEETDTQGKTNAVWNRSMAKKRGSLGHMDLSLSLEKDDYKKRLKKLQRKLYQLQHHAHVAGLSTVLVFEGQDAAGKGGAIRRLVQGLDAQEYQVIPIAAPTREELSHHYLWRFWRHLPRAGRVTIFDRSWYGRVLVERVEGFAQPLEWQRAYREINEFEQQLTDQGVVLLKFWIQIDKDEQLQRFEERQNTPYKAWKITDEDWRNREKWKPYEHAVDDMVSLNHKLNAPWVLVEGNDKNHARVKVLQTVCNHLEAALAKS